MEHLKSLSREELLKLIDVHAKNWLAHDGCWFLAAEEKYGLDAAIDLDTRAWELFRSTPRMYGYDPAEFWSGGPADPQNGVLRLSPWRAEIAARPGDSAGPTKVWHAERP